MRNHALAMAIAAITPVLAWAAPPPTLGAHAFLGQGEGIGSHPAITSPVPTSTEGSVFIAFNAGYANNDGRPKDTYGNAWKPLGHVVPYAGYGDRFDIKAYASIGGKGGSEHRVSVDKPGNPAGELSLSFVEVKHATHIVDVAQRYADTADTMTSATVTVDGPATLLAFWWGDGGVKRMTSKPDDGFQVIDDFTRLPDESGVQGVVAWKDVSVAGTYKVTWHVDPAQGASLWLIAVQ